MNGQGQFSLLIRIMGGQESGRFRGSGRFLGLLLRAESQVPAPEGVLPLFVEHPGPYLQQQVHPALRPDPPGISRSRKHPSA
jgi:hypothetical protein